MPRSKTRPAAVALLAGGAALLLAQAAKRARLERRPSLPGTGKLRVVVVGAGFGGLAVAEGLADAPGVALTMIDTRNHHLFQPLLYQVATAALSPADIAAPVREILPAARDVTVLMAEVTGIDAARRLVVCRGGRHVPYDRLVIATGSEPSYFGHPEWARAAPGLKTLEDAIALRDRGIAALERAALATTQAEQERHLTFVLIGGGPTGVEMAGAIGEFIRDRLDHVYGLPPRSARVILVEAGPRILSAFDPGLSAHAARDLAELGVEVRTGTAVTAISPGRVEIGRETIHSETVIWTAGTVATPVARWLGVEAGHGGRVAVGADLALPGHPDVFVIGDAALARDGRGEPLPALAPVAKQQGHYVAGRILGAAAGRPFRYKDYGTLATIGRDKAIAEFGPVTLTGRPAWLMWAFAHILFLISFRSRALVSLEWLFAYATHARGAGLLIGDLADAPAASAEPSGR